MKNKTTLANIDLALLNISNDDPFSCKLLMLVEGLFGIGVKASCEKYGYSEARFFQLLRAVKLDGVEALRDKKTGPKSNSVRTDSAEKQILRLRFLNPNDSATVIAQKLQQQGTSISIRSVERTITKFGIQKKTATNSTQKLKKSL